MGEWKEKSLIELADIIPGFAFKSNDFGLIGEIVIKIKDIHPPLIDLSSTEKVNTSNYDKNKLKKYLLEYGDFVVAMTGATIGKVGRLKEKKPAFINQRVAKINAKKGVNNDFIYYSVTSYDFQVFIQNNIDSHSAQENISGNSIGRFPILAPPLPEQTAIASILSSLDDKIDLLHRQNATLEKMAETLFRHWFVEEAKEEWDEINFGEFVTPKKGKNITKSEVVEGSYPVVAGGLEPSCYHIEANTKSPVITISASGANAGYIRLYTTPVWSSDSSYIDESITPYVYFCYVFLKINQSKLTDKQEGSAQPHIYPSHIMELDFMSYPESIIKVFEESARPLFNKIKSNQTQIRTLTALRDTLLPKLMSGEVRVEPD